MILHIKQKLLSIFSILMLISTLNSVTAFATENATQFPTQPITGDLEGLLENINIPILCVIIGFALIIYAFFSRKYSNKIKDTEEYNEKSYLQFHKENKEIVENSINLNYNKKHLKDDDNF